LEQKESNWGISGRFQEAARKWDHRFKGPVSKTSQSKIPGSVSKTSRSKIPGSMVGANGENRFKGWWARKRPGGASDRSKGALASF
jgi:hypothetical protein